MRLYRFLLLGAALLSMVATVSCKKDKEDDEESSSKSFTGTVSFTLPAYVSPGEKYTFHLDGISREDGGTYGIVWTVETLGIKDTTRVEADPATVSGDYTLTVPDTLCNFTLKGSAFADGYTTTSSSLSATIVSDSKFSGSITGRNYDSTRDFIFTDSRDDKDYWCTTIGDRDWFRENLACEGTGYPYEGCTQMAQILGNFYSWNEARTACPEGWRLPDSTDWSALSRELSGTNFGATETFVGIAGKLMSDAYFNGSRMWEYWPKVNITDSSRFSAIPAGYAIKNGEENYGFTAFCKYAAFWVNDTYGDQAIYRYLYVDKTDCFVGTADKDSFLASVRCVRDR